MGSDIRTPAIDALARNGALPTSMSNCVRRRPIRASLLTSAYPGWPATSHVWRQCGRLGEQRRVTVNGQTVGSPLGAGPGLDVLRNLGRCLRGPGSGSRNLLQPERNPGFEVRTTPGRGC